MIASARMRQYNPVIDAIELHILHHASEDALYGFWMIEELAQRIFVGREPALPEVSPAGAAGTPDASRQSR